MGERIVPPFARECLKGFEWIQAIAEIEGLRTTQDAACKQEHILRVQDVGTKCAAMAAAALCPNVAKIAEMWDDLRDPPSRLEFMGRVQWMCKRLGISAWLVEVTAEVISGEVRWTASKVGTRVGRQKDPERGFLVWVKDDREGSFDHLLPASQVEYGAIFGSVNLLRGDSVQEGGGGVALPSTESATSSPQPSQAGVAASAESGKPPGATSTARAKPPAAPALTKEQLANPLRYKWNVERPAWEVRLVEERRELPFGQSVPDREPKPEDLKVYNAFRTRRLKEPALDEDRVDWYRRNKLFPEYPFVGVQEAPVGFIWVGGFVGANYPREREAGCSLRLLPSAASLASATLACAGRYKESAWYLPVSAGPGLRKVRERQFMAADTLIETFSEGDLLQIGRRRYSVQAEGPLLRLKCVLWKFELSRALPLPTQWQAMEASLVSPGKSVLPGEVGRRVDYLVVQQGLEEGVPSAAFRVAHNWARQCDFGKTKEVAEAVDALEEVSARTRLIQGDAHKYTCGRSDYPWGYCYSCGRPAKGAGRLEGRVCKECSRGNSAVGRLVAEGKTVASISHPIVYPGVVNTVSQHPPLKPGTKTFASSSNFR